MKHLIGSALALAVTAISAGCATTGERQVASAEQECRELLVPNSNTLRTLCMSAEQWDAYERNQAAFTQNQVERMQGSVYGPGL